MEEITERERNTERNEKIGKRKETINIERGSDGEIYIKIERERLTILFLGSPQ